MQLIKMSKVLMIRHLPISLSFQEKEQLLKHFGAERVWQTSSKRNYVFAAFSTLDQARCSLNRLHQLEIAQKRLVVEYSAEHEPVSSTKRDSQNSFKQSNHIKEFLKSLNSWNPSIGFHQPPPPHLNYKYPPATPEVLVNIIYSIWSHKPLYVQLLHLMNKMCLNSPFEVNSQAVETFQNVFRHYFSSEPVNTVQSSEAESELSSDEPQPDMPQKVTKLIKRKHLLPKTRKRMATMLSTASLPVAKKKANHQHVFEEVTLQEPKKISMLVPKNSLENRQEVVPEIIGEIGKLQKEEPTEQDKSPTTDHAQPEKPTITKKQLLESRLSYSDMKKLSVYKNYHPGEPSMRLYLKNLAKGVTEQDVIRIYRRYIEDLGQNDQIAFDVRIMQEGRMKGQGFVTFPSVEIAQVALNETNGYILKDKPIVVQFARVANKK